MGSNTGTGNHRYNSTLRTFNKIHWMVNLLTKLLMLMSEAQVLSYHGIAMSLQQDLSSYGDLLKGDYQLMKTSKK